ncbi:PAS domain-containing sensor histidine kinase [Marinilabilia rubra]|nr:ATP-binding protein [Marinilabilia rubra]
MGDLSDNKKDILKQKALQLLHNKESLPGDIYNSNLEELVENLQVYQFELEMQNEELKRVQDDLTINKEKFQTIFELAPVGYCMLNMEGTIIQCNNKFRSHFNIPKNNLNNRKLRELVEPSSQDDFYFHLKVLKERKEKSNAFLGFKGKTGTIHIKINSRVIYLNSETREKVILCALNDISDEVKYYHKLKDSEERFRSLVDSMNDVIFTIDQDLRHSSVHGKWVAEAGRKEADFLGKRATEILGEEAGEFHEKHFREALAGKPVVYEWTAGEGTGQQHFQTSLSPIYNEEGHVKEIVGVGRNITPAKKSNFDLQERMKEQKCLYKISKTLHQQNHPTDDILHQCVRIIPEGFQFPEKARACIKTSERNYFSHEAFNIDEDICLKSQPAFSGGTLAQIIIKYSDQDSGDLTRLSSSFLEEEQQLIDVIARNLVQALKNQQTKDELDRKNNMLSQLNAEKDRLLSVIAHDLRSPFSSILGLIGLMHERFDRMQPEYIKELLGALNKSTNSFYTLLENLLEWSRIQRGQKEIKPTPHLVSEIVNQAIEAHQNIIDNKNIKLNLNFDNNLRVLGDQTSLISVFNNLLSNAIKFSEKGGEISILAKPQQPDNIIFSVCDQGIGLSKDMQQKLFKVDADVKRPGTDNEPSTGLGLLISKELVEMNGGEIWVESEEDKGSCFFFTIARSN